MMEECCNNCEFMHRLKHNLTEKGFKESFACDVLLHIADGDEGWIQECTPHGMCEMYTEKRSVSEL